MNKTVLAILAILVCFTATARTKHKKKSKSKASEIVSIQVYRTGCFGRCPTYSVDINRNGIATYTAIQFNTDSGVFVKNIGTGKAAQVLDEAASYHLDTCKEMYPNQIPDLPNINFEIAYTGRTKKIYSAKYGPLFLQKLCKTIEDAGKKTDDTGWKKQQ